MLYVFVLCVCTVMVTGQCCTESSLNTACKFQKGSNNVHEDARLKVPELVRKYGYPMEVHQVITSDGYILTMHRIPYGRDRNKHPDSHKQVVFVMHGLFCSSGEFVLMGPGFGLAYILVEAGFDVWLGNARGNRYSRNHTTLDPDATAFWQFSWDEIGGIDQPAMIDYILEYTRNKRLHFIGHSQGTTTFFVMGSLRPEYNDKIKSMHAMGPVAYLTHSFCLLIRAITPICVGSLEKLADLIGKDEFLPNSVIRRWAGEQICRDEAITQKICSNILFLFGGYSPKQHNATMIPVMLGHTPAGSSVRQVVHYAQVMRSADFQRFDHGWLKNILIYGTFKPPLYDLSKIRAPVYLHYSPRDPFCNLKDVERLWRELGNPVAKFEVPMSHIDFAYGIEAKKYVYDRIIDIMKRKQEPLRGYQSRELVIDEMPDHIHIELLDDFTIPEESHFDLD